MKHLCLRGPKSQLQWGAAGTPRLKAFVGHRPSANPTLELQGLAGCQLPQLAMRQGELVALELKRHGALRLGDSARRAREGSQLGYLDHLPTCGDAEETRKKTLGKSFRLLY